MAYSEDENKNPQGEPKEMQTSVLTKNFKNVS